MSNMCVAAACGGPGGTGSSYGAVWQRSGGASSNSGGTIARAQRTDR